MKNIFKLFMILMGSLCLLSTNAFALDDAEVYYSLEDLTDSSGNGYTLTNYGATSGVSGLIDDSYSFDGTNDYVEDLTTSFLVDGSSFSVSFWAYSDGATDTQNVFAIDTGTNTQSSLALQIKDQDGDGSGDGLNARFYYHDSSGSFRTSSFPDGFPANQWVHVVITMSETGTNYMYIDNSLFNSFSSSGSFRGNADRITLGTQSTNYYDGKIDEFGLWSRVLSSGEISQLYNSGNGYNPYGASPNGIQTDIKEFYNSSSIDIEINTSNTGNLSYSLNNGTLTSICNNCNTTTLSLNSLSEGVQSILFESVDENGAINTTQTFTIDTTNPTINILNTSELNQYLIDWTNVFSYSDTNFDSCYVIVEETNQDCSTYTFVENGNQSIQVFVNDSAGNIANESFNIFVNPYQYFYFEDPSTNPISNFTLGGINYEDYAQIKTYDLGLGNQTLLFSKYGYAQTNISFTLTTTSQINTTETIQVALLYVNIRDRNTGNLISQEVNFDLVGESYSSSYSTTSGQKTIVDIKELPGVYRLSFSSENYANNEYYFQHVGFSEVNITTYLINESLTIPIKIIVRDIFSNPIDACIVKVKQYFIDDNDYISVDMGSTNSLGEILFDLEYDEYYQFVIECDGIIQTEAGQKITSTPLYITFDENEQLSIFEDLPNIVTEITFDELTNTTGYFRFEYDDSNNIVSEACLRVYEEKFNGDILIDESCQNSASATINVNIDYINNKKYVAKGFVTYNNKEYFVDSETKHFIQGLSAWDKGIGLWASVLIIGVLFLIGTAMHPFAAITFAWLGAFTMIQFGALAISEASLLGIGALLIGILIFRGDKL